MNPIERITELEMREWLLECFSDEYDQEQIQELTYEQLKSAVNRYYAGGFEVFLDDMLNFKVKYKV